MNTQIVLKQHELPYQSAYPDIQRAHAIMDTLRQSGLTVGAYGFVTDADIAYSINRDARPVVIRLMMSPAIAEQYRAVVAQVDAAIAASQLKLQAEIEERQRRASAPWPADITPTATGYGIHFRNNASLVVNAVQTPRGVRLPSECRTMFTYLKSPLYPTYAEAEAALPAFHAERMAELDQLAEARRKQEADRQAAEDAKHAACPRHSWQWLSHEEVRCVHCGCIEFRMDE
jgi:hypothetical protein